MNQSIATLSNWVTKILLIIPILLLLVIQKTEGQIITQYANFRLHENGEMIWQKVYERPGIDLDSLKKIIYSNVTLNGSMRIIEESDDNLVIDMKEMIFEKNGNLYNGRLIFEVKEGKYRVTLSGVRIFFGYKYKMNLSFWLGSNTTMINDMNVGLRLEDHFLTKDRKSLKDTNGLDRNNGVFENNFDYKAMAISNKKDDW